MGSGDEYGFMTAGQSDCSLYANKEKGGELINKIGSCDAGTYISAEEQIKTCFGNIESSEPNWRNTTRNQLLGCEED